MYRCYNRNCCCNNMQKNTNENNNSALEDICDDIDNDKNCCENNKYDECKCGFYEEESVFPINPMLGQSYVPIQKMTKTFTPCCGLKNGTIFPELVSPYYPGQSMQQIDYIRNSNTIGKGCNKC